MGGIETKVVEIFGWKGFNASDPVTEIDPRYVTEAKNIDFDYGILSKRRGVTHVWTISGATNFIYDFQSQQGFTSTTDHVRTLFAGGTQLQVCASFPSSTVISATFSVSNAFHYAATGKAGDCFISNENGGIPKLLFYYSGAWHYISAALDPPTIASTITAGSTGSSTGSYYQSI